MNFKKKLPMILTILRFILVIPFIYFLLIDKPVYLIISLIIYSLASITDWFDGFFARKFN
ncbi:MAG: CDP-alcohol phosphatidyltransferase family protein, partial [Spirochaetota bacterium]